MFKVIWINIHEFKYFVKEAKKFFLKNKEAEESIEWGKKQLDIIESKEIDCSNFIFDDALI